jgi:hypothetical protein
MAEIDRRTVLRGALSGAAFITAGGVAITTPELADAIPLAAEKSGPIKTDDLFGDQDLIDRVQYLAPSSSQVVAPASLGLLVAPRTPRVRQALVATRRRERMLDRERIRPDAAPQPAPMRRERQSGSPVEHAASRCRSRCCPGRCASSR